jgi:UDPglucose 6-dehydrogenase
MRAISIFGLGYVGLCTAACFADRGFKVVGVDVDEEKVKVLAEGRSSIHEPGLEPMLQKAIKGGTLRPTLDAKSAVEESDVSFITVGTPSGPDGRIDLKHVELAARDVGSAMRDKAGYHLVVVKSTVTPGTTQNVIKPILEEVSTKSCGRDFGLCVNPEFLQEGDAIRGVLEPDRIVIGEFDGRSGDELEKLYRDFYGERMPPVIRTNLPTAEVIKYASNAFLAAKISFINTIANICERVPGADVTVVARGIGLDKRTGPLFLNAGIGYGGSCFKKDIEALIDYSKNLGYRPELLEAVEKVNESQPYRAVELCKKVLGSLKGKRVAVLGLAFKPNTDDMREARSIPIIRKLLEEGAEVIAYDPVAVENAKAIFKNEIAYAPSAIGCLKNADCCILVTEWEEFKRLKPEDFIQNMRQPVLVDGRRIYDQKEFGGKLKFSAIGLGPHTA